MVCTYIMQFMHYVGQYTGNTPVASLAAVTIRGHSSRTSDDPPPHPCPTSSVWNPPPTPPSTDVRFAKYFAIRTFVDEGEGRPRYSRCPPPLLTRRRHRYRLRNANHFAFVDVRSMVDPPPVRCHPYWFILPLYERTSLKDGPFLSN